MVNIDPVYIQECLVSERVLPFLFPVSGRKIEGGSEKITYAPQYNFMENHVLTLEVRPEEEAEIHMRYQLFGAELGRVVLYPSTEGILLSDAIPKCPRVSRSGQYPTHFIETKLIKSLDGNGADRLKTVVHRIHPSFRGVR